MFGPGAANAGQVSPFFRLPAGVAPGTSSVTVNFSADALLGPGAHIKSDVATVYGRFDADYELTDTWSFNAGFLVGLDESRQQNFSQLCGSCFNLSDKRHDQRRRQHHGAVDSRHDDGRAQYAADCGQRARPLRRRNCRRPFSPRSRTPGRSRSAIRRSRTPTSSSTATCSPCGAVKPSSPSAASSPTTSSSRTSCGRTTPVRRRRVLRSSSFRTLAT